jgi:DNA-binding Lrp family transcriptional regulator
MGVDDYARRPESPAQGGETGRGPTESAGERDDVTDLGAPPRDRFAALQVAERGDRDHQHVTAHHVSPDDTCLDQVALVAQPVSESLCPERGQVGGCGESDQQRGRHGTHRGNVGEILRGSLAADVVRRRPVAAKVPAIDKEIGRRNHSAVGRAHYGGVVARPEQCVDTGRKACCHARDEAELPQVADADLSPPGCSCYGVTDIVGHPRIGLASAREGFAARSTVWQTGHDLEGLRAMVVQAYILIQTEVGKAASVARAISGMKGVTLAEDVTGPYDVIVRAEARNIDEMGRMVVAQVQSVDGITRTLTCPVVHL